MSIDDIEVTRAVAQIEARDRITQIERELLGDAPGEGHKPAPLWLRVACDVVIVFGFIIACVAVWFRAQGSV
ncbi:MAG: hypothetical protein L0H70_07345 [Xanthomonadales bacterium]|nr:hypothetical protein [Xanthomonadales bacterium]